MDKIGLSEAGEALRDYFGPRLNADREGGKDRMVDALVERLHVTKGEAKKLVDDLIDADSIHFVPGGSEPGVVPQAPIAGSQIGAGGQPSAIVGGFPSHAGYWQFK